MAGSIKDQMLQLGLISKQQAAETRAKKKRKKPKTQRGEKSVRQQELDALSAHKRERDRELNRQREIQKKAREQADWVRQVIAQNALQRPREGDELEVFQFALATKVHRVHVPPPMRKQLVAGELGIVQFDGLYHVLPLAQARRVAERAPKRSWLPGEAEKSAEGDPYAEYEVPDDLMW